jgi:predicted DNA-binding WGR domain protein
MIHLRQVDPARRRKRFYVGRVGRTLFGEWSLPLEWGRIGSTGRVQLHTFASEGGAKDAEHQPGGESPREGRGRPRSERGRATADSRRAITPAARSRLSGDRQAFGGMLCGFKDQRYAATRSSRGCRDVMGKSTAIDRGLGSEIFDRQMICFAANRASEMLFRLFSTCLRMRT